MGTVPLITRIAEDVKGINREASEGGNTFEVSMSNDREEEL